MPRSSGISLRCSRMCSVRSARATLRSIQGAHGGLLRADGSSARGAECVVVVFRMTLARTTTREMAKMEKSAKAMLCGWHVGTAIAMELWFSTISTSAARCGSGRHGCQRTRWLRSHPVVPMAASMARIPMRHCSWTLWAVLAGRWTKMAMAMKTATDMTDMCERGTIQVFVVVDISRWILFATSSCDSRTRCTRMRRLQKCSTSGTARRHRCGLRPRMTATWSMAPKCTRIIRITSDSSGSAGSTPRFLWRPCGRLGTVSIVTCCLARSARGNPSRSPRPRTRYICRTCVRCRRTTTRTTPFTMSISTSGVGQVQR
eukprot:comp21049_c0_seq1/m.44228 comp21049_c0_seq1/g.44228  ORF comp21049_c0_seq1/g.44228 comp21049_c0_seq1/m.44228 type:complete len:317 (-) comp21049_c0_seq1:26-976(-)